MEKLTTNILLVGSKEFNLHPSIFNAFSRKGVNLNVTKMTKGETEDVNVFNTVLQNIICIFLEEDYDWFYNHRNLIQENIPIVVVCFKKDHDDLYYKYGATAVISTMAWEWYFDETEHIIDVCLYSATYHYCVQNDIPLANYTFKNTTYNPRTRVLTVKGTEYPLSRLVAYLLEYILSNIGRVIPFKEILKYVWYDHSHNTRRCFDVHVTHLRNYLKDDPTLKIETVSQQGIKLTYNPNI